MHKHWHIVYWSAFNEFESKTTGSSRLIAKETRRAYKSGPRVRWGKFNSRVLNLAQQCHALTQNLEWKRNTLTPHIWRRSHVGADTRKHQESRAFLAFFAQVDRLLQKNNDHKRSLNFKSFINSLRTSERLHDWTTLTKIYPKKILLPVKHIESNKHIRLFRFEFGSKPGYNVVNIF